MAQKIDSIKAAKRGILVGCLTPVMIVATTLFGAFPIMIGLGAAHVVWPVIPALGFWETLLISWGLGALISKFRPMKFDLGDFDKE
jgi:hypothetical protein